MGFTKSLLEDIEKLKGSIRFESIIERIEKAEYLGIWGTGLAGMMIYEALRRFGIDVDFFLDNKRKELGGGN